MKPITQEKLREIVADFAEAIRKRKTKTAKPSKIVINFRDEKRNSAERDVEVVPISLLRYRKDNGRIASDVMNHEKLIGSLNERDAEAQEILRGFLKNKDPEKTDILIKSIEHSGQNEPAIITCDGFLINGNRRKMAIESLHGEQFKTMKVVILPGPGEEGGPPTLLEIERLENRYQLQSEGKSEYYGFDRALSIKRKMELAFSLEEQLRDDPRYANATAKELEAAVRECIRDYLQPLECVDRYLRTFNREGMYGTVSAGQSDKEGRWQAFTDYSKAYHTSLAKKSWQIEFGVDDEEIGTIEDAAFKMIRLRTLKGLPKIHMLMRALPKLCGTQAGRKDILTIADEVDESIPEKEMFDANGNPLPREDVDGKWAAQFQETLIFHTKRALAAFENSRERETPLALLDAALKKLTHEDLSVENISHADYDAARMLAAEIQKRAKEIERELYDNRKKFEALRHKK
jgi:hypothetical protein